MAVAMSGVSLVDAAEPNASEPAEQLEETIVSEHPPLLVYFRHATPSLIRIARLALRTSCRERASPPVASNTSPEDGPAFDHFCSGAKPTILMGVNYRDEFNKTLYACRTEMDLHYIAYPLYWGNVFNDPRWCARIEYDHEARHYSVTQ